MTEENSEIKFYRARDSRVQTLGQQRDKNNGILFSVDKLNMYGNFNGNLKSFSERRDTVKKEQYPISINREHLKDNRQTYYITNADNTSREYPAYIAVDHGSLIIISDQEDEDNEQ